MDAAKPHTNQKPSTRTVSGEYNRMDQMSSSVALRNINTPASLYLANEMSSDSVMSELNMYRPTATTLPLWNGTPAVTHGINYSTISTPGATSTNTHHAEQDSVTSNATKPGSSSSYDIFQGNCSGDDNAVFQLSPNVSNHDSHSRDDLDADDDQQGGSLPKRKKRTPVPDERKDAKYWARRRKNNDAAKRSRDMRRKKLDVEITSAREALTENQKLKQEIDVLKAEINSLRRLLKDANTTLSLWIRARQSAEPNVPVPPMLRGSNSLFVNFPVSTST